MAKKSCSRFCIFYYLILITVASLLILTKGHAAQVTLAWDPTDPEPDGYRLYHRLEGEEYDDEDYIWSGTEPTATVSNLDDDTGHYFVVRAFEGEVESSDSNEVYFISETTIDGDDDGTTAADDTDSDDDGITDADEEIYGTSSSNADSDGDGIQDGTEIGLTLEDIGSDTDLDIFIPDADPTTTTSPINWDTDGDMISDGDEDLNFNGSVDEGESDPIIISSVSFPMILRPLLLDD